MVSIGRRKWQRRGASSRLTQMIQNGEITAVPTGAVRAGTIPQNIPWTNGMPPSLAGNISIPVLTVGSRVFDQNYGVGTVDNSRLRRRLLSSLKAERHLCSAVK